MRASCYSICSEFGAWPGGLFLRADVTIVVPGDRPGQGPWLYLANGPQIVDQFE